MPPPACAHSTVSNGSFPGRCLLGRTAGAHGVGPRLSATCRHSPGRRLESKPVGDGSVRAADHQPEVGGRARQRTAYSEDDAPAERFRCERFPSRRHRPRAAGRAGEPNLPSETQRTARRHRRRSRPVRIFMACPWHHQEGLPFRRRELLPFHRLAVPPFRRRS